MSFAQQLIVLLSEPPSNLVYHLLVLFALQATWGMALWQCRHSAEDAQARQLAWASGGMLFLRLVWVVVLTGLPVMFQSVNVAERVSAGIFPPLEQTINTLTILLVIWSLIPFSVTFPRLNNALLWLSLLLTVVLAIFLGVNWYAQLEQSAQLLRYNQSPQILLWTIWQLVILGLGLGLVFIRRTEDDGLRAGILLFLFLAHAASLANYFYPLSTATDTPYWTRLGHLLAFPLLAVFTYRHNLRSLLLAQLQNRPQPQQIAEILHRITPTLHSSDHLTLLPEMAHMVEQMVDIPFAAVGMIAANMGEHLQMALSSPDGVRPWRLKIREWTAIQLALEQKQVAELHRDGLGSRQLHLLCQEFGVSVPHTLLVIPLATNSKPLGVLLLANLGKDNLQMVMPAIADYFAHLLDNARRYDEALHQLPLPETSSGRLIALQEERNRLAVELETVQNQLTQTEQRLLELANLPFSEPSGGLNEEVNRLREALTEAEETIARLTLNQEIAMSNGRSATYTKTISANEERLHKAMGMLSHQLKQEADRIRAYRDMLTLAKVTSTVPLREKVLNQLAEVSGHIHQFARAVEHLSASRMPAMSIQPELAIDTAINQIVPALTKKNLRLFLDIRSPLHPLTIHQEALQDLISYLLEQADNLSETNQYISLQAYHSERKGPQKGMLHLIVRGSSSANLKEQHWADLDKQNPHWHWIRALAQAYHGEIQFSHNSGQGITFTLTFPLEIRKLELYGAR